MPTTQEKITQLENDANRLVQNLELLYQKAGSYNVAKDELQKTNLELVQLIEQTKSLGEESHNIISKINEIGSSKIFNQLDEIDRELSGFNHNSNNNFKTIFNQLDEIDKELSGFNQNSDNNFKTIFNQLDEIDRELSGFNQNSNNNFKTNKVLLIITIGLLTVSIIISVLIYLK